MRKYTQSLDIRHLEINPIKKTVVCKTDKSLTRFCNSLYKMLGAPICRDEGQEVTRTTTCDEDDFDPYVGSALAICYNLFGSKTQFHKYVDANIKEWEYKQLTKVRKQDKKDELNSAKATTSTTKRK